MKEREPQGLEFFSALEPLPRFSAVLDPARFSPLPDGWFVGVADVAGSTAAIAAGRYKAVNMAGAGVIAAVLNALGNQPFPFVFGGDGAAFALPPGLAEGVCGALAATATWALEELQLKLRVALVPVAAVRKAGHDVRVARHAPAGDVAFAMFAGGGVSWAEAQMKAGHFGVPPAAPGSRPDLSGLSCRWSPSRTRQGVILSLLAQPAAGHAEAFADLSGAILARVRRLQAGGRPLPPAGPAFSWRAPGLMLEAKVPVGVERRPLSLWKLYGLTLFAWFLFVTGFRVGGFDPARYRRKLVANCDYRKFDDGLKLTVDCTPAEADAIEALLREGERAGICRFGLHRQEAALITCLVPSYARDDHVHFIDGADGGYAAAAVMLKRPRAAPSA